MLRKQVTPVHSIAAAGMDSDLRSLQVTPSLLGPFAPLGPFGHIHSQSPDMAAWLTHTALQNQGKLTLEIIKRHEASPSHFVNFTLASLTSYKKYEKSIVISSVMKPHSQIASSHQRAAVA